MNLRQLLVAKPEDIDNTNDRLLVVHNNKIKSTIWHDIILRNNRIFSKEKTGYGKSIEKGHIRPDGDGETWTEYEHYKDTLVPIFNSDTFTEQEIIQVKNMPKDKRYEYAIKNPDKMLRMGDNGNGKLVVWKSEFMLKENLLKLQNEYDNLHIVVMHSCGNILYNGQHYVLSYRVPTLVWNGIKHCFRYTDTSKINDEVWGAEFKGYEIIPNKIEELESLLEIPENLRLEALTRKHKLEVEEIKNRQKEKKQLKTAITQEFSPENSIPTGIQPGDSISLTGHKIYFTGKDTEIYGGGTWFIIEKEHIWFIKNNGADGDNWSYNNIKTGGAGAIGWKFTKTNDRMDLLNRLETEGGFG